MAIKITTDGIVKTVRPFKSYFSLQDLEKEVGDMVEPVKIGPVWVMYSENANKEELPINRVASSFFDVAMYGSVVIVPPQQLPPEWDIMDEIDYKYAAEQVDEAILSAIQRSLVVNANMPIYTHHPFPYKEEFTFRPPNELSSDDESTRDFYRQICEHSIDVEKLKKEGIVIDELDVVVLVKDHKDKIKMIEQMIECYLETEEYEQCAKLNEIKKELESTELF